MTRIVVPFRGGEGKQRLTGLGRNVHRAVVVAMLADVVAAVTEVGSGVVVTADDDGRRLARKFGAEVLDDPGGGQGAAVVAALRLQAGPALVVNADLPCVRPEDLGALLAAIPLVGIALVPSADGRTNALGLAQPQLFEPLYGPRSAERFARAARARGLEPVTAEIPNLADDVDTLADLERVRLRVGPRTRDALQGVRLAS